MSPNKNISLKFVVSDTNIHYYINDFFLTNPFLKSKLLTINFRVAPNKETL